MTKILVVDDVEDNIVLLTFDLEDDGFDVEPARSGQECLDKVAAEKPDMILLDIRMPGLSGLETLEILKSDETTRMIPVIMVSATSGDQSIIRALDLGAHDFVSKPIEYPVLAARMRSALRLIQAKRDLEKANKELERLATRDPLTGTNNRRSFFKLAEAELTKTIRHGRDIALLMIDADHFKMINDSYGHAAGDEALLTITEVCKNACRESDILARLGGEEFAICCPDTNLDGAYAVAERIRQQCENTVIEHNSVSFGITLSIGVTTFVPGQDNSITEVLQRADNLLYQAKEMGRNRSIAC